MVIGLAAPARTDASSPSLDIPSVLSTLPNGLRVLVHAAPQATEVIVAVQYRAGSKDDPSGRTGLAHLYEHLMFTGTPELPGDYNEVLSSAGARNVNASTNFDVTEYVQHGPPGLLEFLLFAEADRMHALPGAVRVEAIEQQRAIVLQEKRQRDAGGADSVFAALVAGCHPPGHPYASLPIGQEMDILAITREDLMTWGALHYAPSNATLLVAGPVDVAHVQALAQTYFAHIAPGPRAVRRTRWLPPRQPTRRDRLPASGSPGGALLMAWVAPEDTDPNADLFPLLAAGLDDAQGPLRRALCQPDGPASAVRISVELRQLCSVAVVEAALRADDDETALKAEVIIRQLFQEVWDAPDLRRQLENRRVGVVTETLGALDSLRSRVGMLLAGEARLCGPDGFKRAFERAAQAPLDDVCGLGRRWLSGEPCYVLRLTPAAAWSAIAQDPPQRPRIAQSRAVAQPKPGWTERRLASGLVVRVIEREFDGVARLSWTTRRGASIETRAERGASMLLGRWDRFEAGPEGSGPLAARLQAQGVVFGAASSLAATRLDAVFPANALDRALDGFADAVLRPRYSAQAVATLRAELEETIGHAEPPPGAAMRQTALRLLLGEDHPLARGPIETRRDLATVTAEGLLGLHHQVFDPEDSLLILAGPFTLDGLVSDIEDRLQTWRGRADAATARAPSTPPKASRWEVARVAPSSSERVSLGGWRLTSTENEEDELVLESVVHALNGRLNRLLRAEKGWAYGARCGWRKPDAAGAPGLLTIESSIDPERAGPALASVKALLRDLPATPCPSRDELDQFRRAERHGLHGLWAAGPSAVEALRYLWLHDLPDDHFERRLDRLDQIPDDRPRAACAALADPETWLWVLEGPRGAIGESLSDVGQAFLIEEETEFDG